VSIHLQHRLGLRVRDLRIKRGISSQEKLAEITGLHRTFVGRIERGEANLTLESLARLAVAFEMTLAELFLGVEDTAKEKDLV
jgi:XRE family transcriptional regulator, regulator of sulfur utilization